MCVVMEAMPEECARRGNGGGSPQKEMHTGGGTEPRAGWGRGSREGHAGEREEKLRGSGKRDHTGPTRGTR